MTHINEPLLNEKNNRMTVYPIKYNDIWQLYKKQQANYWTAEELDWSKESR